MQTSESAVVPPEPPRSSDRAVQSLTGSGVLALRQALTQVSPELLPAADWEQLRSLAEQLDWLNDLRHGSRLLVAVVEPITMTLKSANDYFCQLAGIEIDCPHAAASGTVETSLQRLLSKLDSAAVQRLYRRHLLHLVFRDLYQVDLQAFRLLDEPVKVTLHSPLYPEPRCIEFWLRSQQLSLTRREPELDEFAEFRLKHLSLAELEAALADPDQLRSLEHQLRPEHYQITGRLLLEGVDVTEREMIRRITQLLIDRDSILQPHKFSAVDQQMRSLFRADKTVILSIESEQARLFMGSVSQELDTQLYSLESLQHSHLMRAVTTNRVIAVPDLATDCQTECGRQLLALGVRSLLLLPLVSELQAWDDLTHQRSTSPLHSPHTVGLVGLLSDRPRNFDGLDCCRAEQLISGFTAALTAAQRQLVQRRFITSIHPSVEWKFMQEAERRSLGLPAQPVVFTDVYPLYGISDIRGSSDARNRAIQTDLLEQFRLGLAIVEAAYAEQPTALCEQLRQDLLGHMQQLQAGVTVDAEVSWTRYLRDNVEAYFDYFADCSDRASTAIAAYRTACTNEHDSLYQARAAYDTVVNVINTRLREIWDRWQAQMQKMTPHYCDVETTDGIDHMLYAGRSIDPKFGNFQLRSLRYEQLRALCDCAQAMLQLLSQHDTSLQVAHLILVQDSAVDIFHDETTERQFAVRGSRDTRYEIVKKRIDKATDVQTQTRITQPGCVTIVYSTEEEWTEYQQYVRYLTREGWIEEAIDQGAVQPLQGVSGLKYARVRVRSANSDADPT